MLEQEKDIMMRFGGIMSRKLQTHIAYGQNSIVYQNTFDYLKKGAKKATALLQ